MMYIYKESGKGVIRRESERERDGGHDLCGWEVLMGTNEE